MKYRHVAHGFLVDDVYGSVKYYEEKMGWKPTRVDETFAELETNNGMEFFFWQWAHIEKHLGREVMAQVKHRNQQACRFERPEEIDAAYEELKGRGLKFLTKPRNYEWNARAVYFLDPEGFMWELFCWIGGIPLGELEPEKE